MKTVKIGIVGAGRIAGDHVKAFKAIENVNFCGVVGRTPNKVQAFAMQHNIKQYSSIYDLWTACQPDIIIICVNTQLLSTVMEDILKYDWLPFMEKPAGYNYTDAKLLNRLLGNRKAYVGLNRRCLSATLKVLETLEKDTGPRAITVRDQQNISAFLTIPGKEKTEALNLMYANSIHLIDYFRIFGRSPISRIHTFEPFDPDRTVSYSAYLDYENGDTGHYYCQWQGPGGWSAQVNTRDQFCELKPLETAKRMVNGSRSFEDLEISANDTLHKPGFFKQASAIVSTISSDNSDLLALSEQLSFENALQSMELISRIYGGYEFNPSS